MGTVLIFDQDNAIQKILEEGFQEHRNKTGQTNSVTRVQDAQKFSELVSFVSLDVIFVEEAVLNGAAEFWWDSFKKKFPRNTAPVFLCGFATDRKKISELLNLGFQDYLIKPYDRALIIQRTMTALYGPGSYVGAESNSSVKSGVEKQVYSMPVKQAVHIAKAAEINELSEFECTINSQNQLMAGQLYTLYSTAFSSEENIETSILARCISSREHPFDHHIYMNEFVFSAVEQTVLKNIRLNLRKIYVDKIKG
ncbi:MAG: hypothetical protein ACOYOK_08205 [Pseudobdellovibrionaceae bacterium]